MKKGKKAQVTVIIIIAIVLVGILVVFFTFKDKIGISPSSKITEINEIDKIVSNCFEQRSIDAIRLIGLQGGYFNLPENYIQTSLSNIAYGLQNNRNTLSSITNIENEISSFIELTLPFCLEENQFPQIQITQQIPESKTKINEDRIKITASLALSIIKDDRTVTLDRDYEVEIPMRFQEIHATANNIIQNHLDDPEFIDLSYLISTDFDIVFTPNDETTLIYTMTDFESELDGVPYSFLFVIEGRWDKK